MGVGSVCWTSLSTGLSKWQLGPHHAERSPVGNEKELFVWQVFVQIMWNYFNNVFF